MDLSHPTNGTANSGIPKELCSLKYITVDAAIEQIRWIGHGTLLAKIDIKSAFWLLAHYYQVQEWNLGAITAVL